MPDWCVETGRERLFLSIHSAGACGVIAYELRCRRLDRIDRRIVAAFSTALIHRRVENDLRRLHHDVGSVVFLQLGVVFAVLLAFVFSEA